MIPNRADVQAHHNRISDLNKNIQTAKGLALDAEATCAAKRAAVTALLPAQQQAQANETAFTKARVALEQQCQQTREAESEAARLRQNADAAVQAAQKESDQAEKDRQTAIRRVTRWEDGMTEELRTWEHLAS